MAMNIRTARKIADNIGDVGIADSDRRNAFARLNDARKYLAAEDRDRAQKIWDYFGNRADKGKAQEFFPRAV